MAEAPITPKPGLRILLVGHTGHGKSSTGNSLLGENRFKVKRSSRSVTERVELEAAQRFGRNIQITDTPGFFDTNMSNDHIQRQLLAAVVATCPGFNAILFVVYASTITEEIQATVDLMLASFGEDASEFAFLLLTNIANEKDKVEYLADALSDANSKLLQLVSHCKHKVLFIDNTADQCSLEKMSEDIIEAICNNAKNNYFSNDCFQQVAIELKRLGGQSSMESLEDVNSKKKVLEENRLLEALYLVVQGLACFGKAFFYVSSAAHELYMKLGGIKEVSALMKK